MALVLGALPVVATQLLPPVAGLSDAAWSVLGLGLLMVVWWVTEAIPLAATALVPLALLPMFGVRPIADVAPAYAHPLIILFLGGFLIAKAIERSGLHRRIAFGLVRAAGGRSRRMIGGMMAATAFLSLWISNTAAAMVMAPIGLAIAGSETESDEVSAALLLGIAYAATIGGMGSLIGTPPNALFAAYVGETLGLTIGFAEWLAIGLPTVALLLPVTWLLLTRVVFKVPDRAHDVAAHHDNSPHSAGARRVAAIAIATALAWILRPLLNAWAPLSALTDAGIAMIAVLCLFVFPDGDRGRLLDWDSAKTIRWDVLILFGGGLALAGAIDATGLAAWIGETVAAARTLPVIVVVALFAITIVLIGELASNTAIAAVFLPIAGASAAGFGLDPVVFLAPIALASSIGFMLPVATPPNAIVFVDPSVTRQRMLVAGAPLDLIGVLVAVAVGILLAPLVF